MIQHPLSAAFPPMATKDRDALQDDIQARGQVHPIVILDKMILDGWHRYLCCQDLGIEPITAPLADGLDPVAYVQSVNLHRRHLTGSQRAAAVTACQEWAQSGDNQHTRGDEPGAPPTVKEMAKAAEVSSRTIQQAKKAQEAGLGEAVRDGKVSAKQAAEIAKLPKGERQAAIEDPPAPKAKPACAPIPAGAPDQTEVEQLRAELEEVRDRAGEMADDLQASMDENKLLTEENERLHRILDAEDLLTSYKAEVLRAHERARIADSLRIGTDNRVRSLQGEVKKYQKWSWVLEKKLKEHQIDIKKPTWQTGEQVADHRSPMTEEEMAEIFDGPQLDSAS